MKKYEISLIALLLIIPVWGFGQKYSHENSDKASTLTLNIDGVIFFRDNEFNTPQMRGYSLPGFRITPTLEYKIANKASLEGGIYMLHYWGANLYPNTTYNGIPEYSESNISKGTHTLPFLRGKLRLTKQLTAVIGNIYGGENHNLLPQLYARERALTADPETGFQLLLKSKVIDADLWLDWRTFIYYNSPYQENFYVGLSSKIKYNNPQKKFHLYTPIQILLEHRGGEIDIVKDKSVQTYDNFATGLGIRYNPRKSCINYISIEGNILGSIEQTGGVWPYDKGFGWDVHSTLKSKHCTSVIGYYDGDKFCSINGYAFWGAISQREPGTRIRKPKVAYATFNYSHEFAKGFIFTAGAEIYQTLSADIYSDKDKLLSRSKSKTNFSIETTLQISPSFLIKKFKK